MHRKTAKELISNGTFRNDRHRHLLEPSGTLTSLPKPPFELSKAAEAIYTDTGRELIHQGTLKATDLRLLAIYANEMSVYADEMEKAKDEGIIIELPNGISTLNAHRKAAIEAFKNSASIADKLGISTIGRARLGIKPDGGDPEKDDPLAMFVN